MPDAHPIGQAANELRGGSPGKARGYGERVSVFGSSATS